MNIKHLLVGMAMLLSTTTFSVQAALTGYTANGVDFVRMQGGGFDISFTKDTNLLRTLEASNPNLIDTIISSIGSISNTPNNIYDTPVNSGIHILNSADFGGTGRVSWFGAQAFVKYLNNINYGGSNQWSLPSVVFNHNLAIGKNQTGSELGQLFVNELGNSPINILGSEIFDYKPFTSAFWMDEEYAPPQGYVYVPGKDAWAAFAPFRGGLGDSDYAQYYREKHDFLYAWVVSPGQIAHVPLPGAVWLMGSGLLGFLGLVRRGRSKFGN